VEQAKPNFFVVGAPKCGTTSVHGYLSSHPSIGVSQPKEPHYFCVDYPRFRWASNIDEYLRFFRHLNGSEEAIGDFSPAYLFSEAAPVRIAEFCPDARILIFIRRHIDFFLSFHGQMVMNGDETILDPVKAWNLQSERRRGRLIPQSCRVPQMLMYEDICKFVPHIERYCRVFPAENIRIFLFDDLRHQPRKLYKDILQFLALSDDGRTDFPRVNAGETYRNRWLGQVLRRPPPPLITLHGLVKRVAGRPWDRVVGRLVRWNRRPRPRASLPPGFHSEFDATIKMDRDKLSDMLSRDLSYWSSGCTSS